MLEAGNQGGLVRRLRFWGGPGVDPRPQRDKRNGHRDAHNLDFRHGKSPPWTIEGRIVCRRDVAVIELHQNGVLDKALPGPKKSQLALPFPDEELEDEAANQGGR
jgi:hypothetical protein